jgi:hypothetical protein
MGCLKLNYCSDATLPKVMYGKSVLSEKSVQIWLSVDPMSDKYPNLTPYNYCANNPIKLIDPNGEEIWIIGEDGETRIQYTQGMKYTGNDKTIATRVDALNQINDSKNGKTVLNELTGSKNMYMMMNNDGSCSSNANFVENDMQKGGEGGQIMLNDNSLSDMSHELFHAYQSENGGGGNGSIVNEVESYLFQYSIAGSVNSTSLFASTGNNASGVRGYNDNVNDLISSSSFSPESFFNVVKGFKQFSEANRNGNYSKVSVLNSNQPTKATQSLITKFFPLK